MALCNKALLFKFHLIGRDPLNTLLHTYLLYVVYVCAIITFTEAIFRHQVFFALGRAFCVILEGTWLWQLTFILDSPLPDPGMWKSGDDDDLMLTTCIFTWHIGGVLLYSVTCGIGWTCVYKRRRTLLDMEMGDCYGTHCQWLFTLIQFQRWRGRDVIGCFEVSHSSGNVLRFILQENWDGLLKSISTIINFPRYLASIPKKVITQFKWLAHVCPVFINKQRSINFDYITCN